MTNNKEDENSNRISVHLVLTFNPPVYVNVRVYSSALLCVVIEHGQEFPGDGPVIGLLKLTFITKIIPWEPKENICYLVS